MLVVTCAPRERRKMRIPKKYATAETRARFARGAAPEIHRQWLEQRARQAPPVAVASPDPARITFDEFAGL